MTEIVYDVQTYQIGGTDRGGRSGFMSFDRLAKLVQSECHRDERLVQIVVTDQGLKLNYELERKK